MKKYLTSLNGWQRIFVFIVLFIYVPITIDRITIIELSTTQKYSDDEIKIKTAEFLKKENIETAIYIEDIQTDFIELAKKYGGTAIYKNDKEELEALRSLAEINEKIGNQNTLKEPVAIKNSELIKVRFTSDNEYHYIVTFRYIKELKLFYNDADIKKISSFIQSLINQTKIQSEAYIKFLKILLYFSLTTFLTYLVGFMIGWIIKGFKHNKES